MSDLPDPTLSLRWLRRVRWAILAFELAFLALSRAGLLDPLPLTPIAAICATVMAVDFAQASVLARNPAGRWVAVGAHVAFDLVALGLLASLSPDAHQPMQVFFVVEPAVAATVLRPRASVAVAFSAAALQAVAVLGPAVLRGDDELAHLASHAALLGFAGVTTTWFVAQLAAELRERTEALRGAEAARVATERLAALGTLAAGVAHELATPLASVGVLADEAALPGATPEERERAVASLRDQLVRCRDLLRRLKTGPGDLDGRTPDLAALVERWTREWHQAKAPDEAAPVVEVARQVPTTVRGPEERWRGALWTLLDNARQAGGADPIRVRVAAGRAGVPYLEVSVEDRGCGLDPETAARAGEPFFSAWPDGGGQGLGLFAARTFARAVGGDLAIEARTEGGARAILRLPTEAHP